MPITEEARILSSLESIVPEQGLMTSQAKKEIAELEKAREIISREHVSDATIQARIENPLSKVEESLARYIYTRATMDLDRNDFSKLIMDKLAARIDEMSTEQLLGLFGTDRVTSTDAMSKFLGPTSQVITAKQQAEIAAESRRLSAQEKQAGVQIAIGQVGNNTQQAQLAAEAAPRQALQGLTIISQLIQAIEKTEKSDSVDAEIVNEN
mgnify:FL=1